MLTRFLHTSDWHLGMHAHFLPEEARGRFTFDRFEAVKAIASLAAEQECQFVVVAGDVFDSNQVSETVLARAVDALKQFTVPVYLLPGNHDHYSPASVYRARAFTDAALPLVQVILKAEPLEVAGARGVEVLGAPVKSRNQLADPFAELLAVPRTPGVEHRVVVAHGVLSGLTGSTDDPGQISAAGLAQALSGGFAQYVALGDRHSLTEVPGSRDRAYYSGTPVSSGRREQLPNQVLLVTLEAERCEVRRHQVGRWTFTEPAPIELNSAADVARLARMLEAMPDKPRTAVWLSLRGTLSLTDYAELDRVLDDAVFAFINRWERHTDLVVEPTEDDLAALNLSGYAKETLRTLRGLASADGPQAGTARDALNLLYRLAK